MKGRRPLLLTPADRHAAGCLRAMRLAAGLIQQEVAQALGVSAQQIHKYESGTNRLSLGRAAEFAAFYGCHPADLFPDAAPAIDPALRRALAALTPAQLATVRHAIEAAAAAPGAAGERQPAAEAAAGPARPMETSGARPDGRDHGVD